MPDRVVKRVLMSADTVGGVWTFAVELARALGGRGIDVSLATMGRKLDAGQWARIESIRNLQIFESEHKLEWMENPWDDVRRAGEWLLFLEARVKPDVVHLNTLAHGALPWRAPVVITGHSCVLSWWEAVKHESAPGQWDRYRVEVTRSLNAAGLVTAPTRAMLNALQRHYEISAECALIPNGIDFSTEGGARKEGVILAAGRLWDEGKNIAALERIAPRLPWPVYFAGDNSGRSATNFLGRLSFAGLSAWYARASIYALPARYEPFGLSILEAALAGCALVLGDIPSLRELWTGAAIFVDPEDDSQLESALQSLIDDEPRRRTMASCAQRRASEFTAGRMAERYARAYQRVAVAALCAS